MSGSVRDVPPDGARAGGGIALPTFGHHGAHGEDLVPGAGGAGIRLPDYLCTSGVPEVNVQKWPGASSDDAYLEASRSLPSGAAEEPGAGAVVLLLGPLVPPPARILTQAEKDLIATRRDEAKRKRRARMLEQADRAHAAMLVDPMWRLALDAMYI